MNLCFVDLSGVDCVLTTARTAPLGGMQSAMFNLAAELVRLGHRITVLNRTSRPGLYEGIDCRAIDGGCSAETFANFDVVVSISCDGHFLRGMGVRCPLVLWTGHNCDEPSVQKLSDPDEVRTWNRLVLKSQVQASEFIGKFDLDPQMVHIIGNAVSPFVARKKLARKYFFDTGAPPRLIYTSTPFRGLDVLIDAMPLIRSGIPGCTLDVYSSMKVYQKADGAEFMGLYERCRRTEGVTYHGSVNQPELADAMRSADVFAYPSLFRETSCISLMEAMASGAIIASTALGAIPETSGRYGFLMRLPRDGRTPKAKIVRDYAAHVIQTIEDATSRPDEFRRLLDEQAIFAHSTYCWPARAQQWSKFLHSISVKPCSSAQSLRGWPGDNPETKFRIQHVALPGGGSLYVNERDRRGRELAKANGNYNPTALRIWQKLITEDEWDILVDVGANYGEMLANVVPPNGARIVAVEPNPNILPFLNMTLSTFDRVDVVPVALSKRSGQRRFFSDPDWSGCSRLVGKKTANMVVPSTTLDRLLDLGHSRLRSTRMLIKIDVEGHEIPVLQGASSCLVLARNVAALVEVAHLSQKHRDWLCDNFAIYAEHLNRQTLERVYAIDRASLEAGGYYPNDVVIRRSKKKFSSRYFKIGIVLPFRLLQRKVRRIRESKIHTKVGMK